MLIVTTHGYTVTRVDIPEPCSINMHLHYPYWAKPCPLSMPSNIVELIARVVCSQSSLPGCSLTRHGLGGTLHTILPTTRRHVDAKLKLPALETLLQK